VIFEIKSLIVSGNEILNSMFGRVCNKNIIYVN